MVTLTLIIAAKCQRIAMNGVITKIIFTLRTTCISQAGYYVVHILHEYCLVIPVCPLFHIKETVVCKVRPHHAGVVLAFAVISS